VRSPDLNLGVGKTLKESGGPTSFAYQTGLLFQRTFEMIEKEKPDVVMYLGDTNSVLSSVIVDRCGVPVVHIEAGGRSFDWRMPEEKNRTIIDHVSDLLYCYMPRHEKILLREGVDDKRLKVIGNIIYDAIDEFLPRADKSQILINLGIESKNFVLVTLHREENTNEKDRLIKKINDLIRLSKDQKIVFPLMPRVRKNLIDWGLMEQLAKENFVLTNPLGYFDFLKLQKEAMLIITDSGTVQEEALILGVPAVVARLSTERPETIKAGATILADSNLYEAAELAMKLDLNWDRMLLNPGGTSPSQIVFDDLMERLSSDFFSKSRSLNELPKDELIQEAYGMFK
jgi:UDP-N-acetylglucosamine 2-epimerase (non-hydrolysing)